MYTYCRACLVVSSLRPFYLTRPVCRSLCHSCYHSYWRLTGCWYYALWQVKLSHCLVSKSLSTHSQLFQAKNFHVEWRNSWIVMFDCCSYLLNVNYWCCLSLLLFTITSSYLICDPKGQPSQIFFWLISSLFPPLLALIVLLLIIECVGSDWLREISAFIN